ncbi:MAG: NUDIX domain-containing protein [bacterium]
MEKKRIVATVCFVTIPETGEIWLGMKKEGLFGAGKWNGFGGKQEADEWIDTIAVREVWEETGGLEGAGISVQRLEKQGIMEFEFTEVPLIVEMHAYLADKWEGKAEETNEMRPQKFRIEDIPYDDMWQVDRYWLPLLLRRDKFRGKALFNSPEGCEVLKWEVTVVDSLN